MLYLHTQNSDDDFQTLSKGVRIPFRKLEPFNPLKFHGKYCCNQIQQPTIKF